MSLPEAVPMPPAEKFREELCLREAGACDSGCSGAGGRGRADHVEWYFFASQEERAMKFTLITRSSKRQVPQRQKNVEPCVRASMVRKMVGSRRSQHRW